jgi:hypothetical protein
VTLYICICYAVTLYALYERARQVYELMAANGWIRVTAPPPPL